VKRITLVLGVAIVAAVALWLVVRRTGVERPARDAAVAELDASFLHQPMLGTGRVHDLELVAAPTELRLAGQAALRVWAYNGQVPGPTFRVRRGDTVRVRFENRLPEPSTVHWHGVRVPNAMDGVPGVTQPPVKPGESFTYEFVAPDAGTYWFHPHHRGSEQVERGLFGVLLVEDEDPPAFTRELVWVLDDWKLGPEGQIDPAFNTRHDLAHDGRWGNTITVNGEQAPELAIRAGERVRLRIVNVANGRVFKLDFGDANVRGIALDGPYAREPFDPSQIELAPGNRLDIDLEVPPDASGRTFDVTDRYGRRPNAIASLRVSDEAPVATPAFASPAKASVPRWNQALSTPVTKELALNASRGGPFGISWTIAGVAMRHDHGDHAGHDHATETLFSLKRGGFARLAFVNESARIHPMHLHGTFFKVLARNGQPTDEPFFRDTVLVKPRERVDIGLVPLDEGTWMMHCHILEHAESGMMSLFRVE
jgi:FtsP/CotA-like multicopper oxidase with cupredoxin domain